MYAALGPHWSGTLCALLEAVCIPIPFVFYRYGSKIRRKSALIRSMQEDKEKADARVRRRAEKAEREEVKRAEADVAEGGPMDTGAAVYETKDLDGGGGHGVLEKEIG